MRAGGLELPSRSALVCHFNVVVVVAVDVVDVADVAKCNLRLIFIRGHKNFLEARTLGMSVICIICYDATIQVVVVGVLIQLLM